MYISNLSRVFSPCIVAGSMMFLISSACPVPSYADIYRFVTVDGVETFTDAPSNKQAKVIIKDSIAKQGKKKKNTGREKTRDISLDEIVAKTVNASLSPQDTNATIVPRLPSVGGTITSVVGMRTDPIDGKWRQHNGIDIALREGTPVPPAAPGVVVYSGQRSGYGNTVIVEHSNGMITLYGHNSRLMVSSGQIVDSDTVLALSGNTGRSTGPHLHFEAWQGGTNITSAFLSGSREKLPQLQLASFKSKVQFRKETLSDGSVLFTNIPSSTP
ncbi:M23 family metallopeptidase [Pelotalea chapellei]|nr:M23 family metallopeptidase [Pelotalea chapellei]